MVSNGLCSFPGLLTVDPKRRLTMSELRSSTWLKGSLASSQSITPLVTPDVLSLTHKTMNTVNGKINRTLEAFHLAHREGFRLQNVDAAPLAQRRKKKRSSSSSCDSIASFGSLTPTKSLQNSPLRTTSARNSPCSLRNSPIRNLSNNSNSSAASGISTQSTGFQPLARQNLENSGYFSFRDTKIAQLLSSTSTYVPSPLVEDTSFRVISEKPAPSSSRMSSTSSISAYSTGGRTTASTSGRTATGSMSSLSSSTIPSRMSSLSSTTSSSAGIKRSYDEELSLDEEDDCVITGETLAPSRSGSDIANNNAKRQRGTSTVVIDD